MRNLHFPEPVALGEGQYLGTVPSPAPTTGLHYLDPSPLGTLAVAEHRVAHPRATVVTVHGGLDRGASFTRLSRRLEDCDVVAYDRRGYQRSRDMGPGTLAQHVDDLRRVIRWAARTAPIVLMGHSYGGLVSMTLVSDDDNAADVVVAFEAPLPWVLGRPTPTPPPGDNVALEAERFFRRVVSDEAWEHLSAREQESRRLDGPALRADLEAMTSDLAPFELSDITTPVRYLYGDQRAGEYYSALAQRLTVGSTAFTSRVMSGAPHGAHLSHPDLLAREVRSALTLADNDR